MNRIAAAESLEQIRLEVDGSAGADSELEQSTDGSTAAKCGDWECDRDAVGVAAGWDEAGDVALRGSRSVVVLREGGASAEVAILDVDAEGIDAAGE